MKIMYFITTLGHGRGGHFYDLATIAETLSYSIECVIVNIGLHASPALEGLRLKTYNVLFDFKILAAALRDVRKLIRKEQPDVLHSFDNRGFFVPKIMSWLCSKPLIFTKCGGPNPMRFYPHAKNMILFSGENLKYFSNRSDYSNSNLHLLPNRVKRVQSDCERIGTLKKLIEEDCPVFLRIARFCDAYKDSALQSINLVQRLNQDGIRCKLLLLGVIEDSQAFKHISSKCDETINLITDPRYTTNASELIDVSDFVIGTGRGLMEAASLGKILLTPLSKSELPVLVRKENLDQLFAMNFSPRNVLQDFSPSDNFGHIVALLRDTNLRKEYRSFALELFEKYFNVDNVVDKYLAIYNSVNGRERLDPMDISINAFQAFKSWNSEKAK